MPIIIPNSDGSSDSGELVALKTYLGHDADQWDDAALLGALAAESADQAARCKVPTPVPASLSEALFRRVSRNLALRAVPLGVITGETGGQYVGGRDPEVRRLEAPYRKWYVA